MPEHYANQALGLRGLGDTLGPQLTAVVSHGDDKSELPLLWQLCTALVGLGYHVTVLDGTHTESDANPGLEHLLDSRLGTAPQDDSPGWTTVPAAAGLRSLWEPASPARVGLQRLAAIAPAGSVLVLYAGVEPLVKLLSGSTVRPLLSVSSDKNALVTSYLALKRLLLRGGLEPTILNMMQDPRPGRQASPASVARSLCECARNFLGYELNTIPMHAPLDTPEVAAQMRRLAMRLLENALPLERAAMIHASPAHWASSRQMSRSH